MFKRSSVNYSVLAILLDGLIIGTSLAFANILRPYLNVLPFSQTLNNTLNPIVLYPLFIILWTSIHFITSVYEPNRNLPFLDELVNVTIGSIIAAVSLAGILYLSYRQISRLLFIFFVLLTYLSMVFWRVLVLFWGKVIIKNSHGTRHVLIIGAGPVGREIFDKIYENNYDDYKIVGFLDDNLLKQKHDKDVLGPTSDLLNQVRKHTIDDVIVALPRRAHEKTTAIVEELNEVPIKIWVIPDYFSLALHKAEIRNFASIPMLDLRAPALSDYQRLVKRIFDLSIGVLLMILVFPFMIIIGIAIKLDSSGPILFHQMRVGENGHIFWMYKFRSMFTGADKQFSNRIKIDSDGNLIYKQRDDPRITRVGRFLRRTSLDELPQIYNVIRGEMSLVGPRPELPALVDRYESWQRKRFAIPQGITGWWQINGRSDKPMHLHTEDDLYYIQHYSIFLDIKILIRTLFVVLRGIGAY